MRFDETFFRTLDSLVLLARRLQGGRLPGERPSPRPGSSLDFRGFRAYTPGDDLRSVDWNVFARLGRLHVKEFAAERDLEAHIAVDVSASMDFHGKRDQALAVAAVLGTVALSRGDTLSWCAFAEARLAGGTRMRGKGRRAELLRGLEEAGRGRAS
ncbi:MAG: DUF58 domain-containing protein, partial [Candidatus Brocadiae bacterium]|nr:DUF58 domain-containing protein [Candidatus Brocadiia bacterium]